MSIIDRTAAEIQADWNAAEAVTAFPGDPETIAELLNGSDGPEWLPRYRVQAIHSRAMGRILWWVIDASTGEKLHWHAVERNALDLAADLNAEDWPDCGRWWEVQAPSEHFDRPVRLASAPSRARPDRTPDDDLAGLASPPF